MSEMVSTTSDHVQAVMTSSTAGHEIMTTFTLVVEGMPRKVKSNQFEDWLNNFEVSIPFKFLKIKKIPNRDLIFITFDDKEECNKGKEFLDGKLWKETNKTMRAFIKNESSKVAKRKQERESNDVSKKRKTGLEATAPWKDIEYTEQLERKTKAMKENAIVPMLRGIKRAYTDLNIKKPTYLNGHVDQTFGNMKIEDIIPSPKKEEYRNKCELTFGSNREGQASLGFRVSTFDEGTIIDMPERGGTCPGVMCDVALDIHSFLQSTPFEVYNLKTHKGVWRLCTMRYSERSGQLLVFLIVQLSDVEPEKWSTECDRLKQLLQGKKYISSSSIGNTSSEIQVTGLCYCAYNGASVAPTDLPIVTVYGDTTLREIMIMKGNRSIGSAYSNANPCTGTANLSTGNANPCTGTDSLTADATDATNTTDNGDSGDSTSEYMYEASFDIAPTAFFQVS